MRLLATLNNNRLLDKRNQWLRFFLGNEMTTEATKTEEPAKPRRYPTMKEWAKAEALWATGDVTLEELAGIVGVSMTSISLHMKKKGITKGERAKDISKKVAERVAEDAIADVALHTQRIRETKDEHYRMAQRIAALTWNEIVTAKQSRTPFAAITPNLKSLETAMNILQKAQSSRWTVLGLDRPDMVDADQIPELVISELTADEIQQLRDRDFGNNFDFDDDTVTEIDEDQNVG